MIKKRTKKANLRTNEVKENEEAKEDETVREQQTVEIVKTKQRLKKQRGCAVQETGDLFNTKLINEKSMKRQQDVTNVLFGGTQGGLVNDFNKGENEVEVRNISFKFSSKTTKSDAEKQMEQFIEAEMKKKGFLTTQEKQELMDRYTSMEREVENQSKESVLNLHYDDLYKIPEHLRVSRSLFRDDNNTDNNNNNSGGTTPAPQVANPITTEPNEKELQENQQLMTGGIVEVDLPVQFRINNIKETEDAVKSVDESAVKQDSRKRKNTASDNQVYDRFVKRARRNR